MVWSGNVHDIVPLASTWYCLLHAYQRQSVQATPRPHRKGDILIRCIPNIATHLCINVLQLRGSGTSTVELSSPASLNHWRSDDDDACK